jgi:hypothetical protein
MAAAGGHLGFLKIESYFINITDSFVMNLRKPASAATILSAGASDFWLTSAPSVTILHMDFHTYRQTW